MTRIRLPYIHRFKDRHGRVRHYFRRGDVRVPLPGAPGSGPFMEAYQAARDGTDQPSIGASRTEPGTFDALAVAFYQSADFLTLAPSTQRTYRGIIERFRIKNGSRRIKKLEPQHISRILSQMVDRPAAANNLLKVLRAVMRFAVADGWRKDDPTGGVKRLRHREKGFLTWTEEQIAQFEKAHPIGTRARLAMALLLYTGCRRGDVVTLGRQHLGADGVLRLRQHKTGALVEIPVHAELARVLEAAPKDHLTFLTTAYEKPFSAGGFYNWFVECVAEAGLPKGLGPHGLRKAIARRLVEAGATTHQTAAITGHKTLKEIERYTEEARRAEMAREGMATLRPKREQ